AAERSGAAPRAGAARRRRLRASAHLHDRGRRESAAARLGPGDRRGVGPRRDCASSPGARRSSAGGVSRRAAAGRGVLRGTDIVVCRDESRLAHAVAQRVEIRVRDFITWGSAPHRGPQRVRDHLSWFDGVADALGAPHPGSVASGDPYAPRRSLAGALCAPNMRLVMITIVVLAGARAAPGAENWPQWRGPSLNEVARPL